MPLLLCSVLLFTLNVVLPSPTKQEQKQAALKFLAQAKESLANGDRDEAMMQYDAAIRADATLAEAWYGRGVVRLLSGAHDAAVRDLSRAIQLNPKAARAYVARGMIRLDRQELGLALRDFNQAIRADPNNAKTYQYRATVKLQQRNVRGAIQDHSRALQLSPQLSEVWMDRGKAYYHLNQWQAALNDFTQALLLNPQMAQALLHRGMVYRRLGNIEAAEADFAACIKLDPKLAEQINALKKGISLRSPSMRSQWHPQHWKAIDDAVAGNQQPFFVAVNLSRITTAAPPPDVRYGSALPVQEKRFQGYARLWRERGGYSPKARKNAAGKSQTFRTSGGKATKRSPKNLPQTFFQPWVAIDSHIVSAIQL
ncbi:MAG: tetratricopeptide repeat protein [Blastocatellia bacterium]|nr:tetratricopeptide repeat protein [Blastocatellia bacterium]